MAENDEFNYLFEDESKEEKLKFDFKDLIAIFIAMLQTVLLPIVLMFGILLIFAIFIGMVFGSG